MIGQFRGHEGDPLTGVIEADTRSCYTHSVFITDRAKNQIAEEYFPYARKRTAGNDELSQIDVFAVQGQTPEQDDRLRAFIDEITALQIPYWVGGLVRFGSVFRAALGEAKEDDWKHHMFCSMYVSQGFTFSKLPILRGHSFEHSPRDVGMSPLLIPQPALKPITPEVGA